MHSLATPVIQGARRTASDDLQLATKTWSPTPGTATLVGDAAVRTPRTAVAGTAPAFKWTLSEPTDSHGLWVHPDSISISGDEVVSVDASQTFLRTLYAGYRLLNDAGQPLGGTTTLGSVSAADTIMGIPCPTDPTTLQIPLGSASGVELRFGSFGTSNWDQDVSPSGALLTGLWQYGIPAIFLVAGKALESTSLFNKIVNDRQLTAATLAIAFPIVGGGLATATAVANTSSYLIAFGDAVICMVLQKGPNWSYALTVGRPPARPANPRMHTPPRGSRTPASRSCHDVPSWEVRGRVRTAFLGHLSRNVSLVRRHRPSLGSASRVKSTGGRED